MTYIHFKSSSYEYSGAEATVTMVSNSKLTQQAYNYISKILQMYSYYAQYGNTANLDIQIEDTSIKLFEHRICMLYN